MKPKFTLRSFLLAAGSSLLAVSSASAQTDYYWDQNGGTGGTGGTGNWNTTDIFWRSVSDTGTLGVWSNGSNDAIFGGTAGTVTINSGNVTARSLVFNTGGYTIARSGSNTLTINGATADHGFFVNADATISAVIAGSNGLIKNGGGTLSLTTNASTFTGDVKVNQGRLQVTVATRLLGNAANDIVVSSGAQLYVDANNGGTTLTRSGNLTISGEGANDGGSQNTRFGALRLDGHTYTGTITLAADSRIGGASFGGAATNTLSGKITGAFGVDFFGATTASNANAIVTHIISNTGNDYTGNTTITNGAYNSAALTSRTNLRLGASNVIPNGATAGNVVFALSGTNNASTVGLDLNGFSETINGLTVNAGAFTSRITNGATSGTSASVLTIGDNNTTSSFSGIIEDNDATRTLGITKIGNGTLTLSGANTYRGGTTVSAGTLVVTGSLGATTVNVTAGVLQVGSGGAAGTLGAGNVALTSPGNLTFNRSDATYAYGGNISGTGSITQAGVGTTTLASTGSIASAINVQVNSGTLSIAEGGAGRTVANNIVLNGGTLQGLQDNTGTGGTITLSGGNVTHTFTASGTLNLLTAVTSSQLIVGGGGGGGAGAFGVVYAAGGGGGKVSNLTGQALTAGNTTVTVGAGGTAGGNGNGGTGGTSSIGSNTAVGGSGATGSLGTGGASGFPRAGGTRSSTSAGGGGGDSAVGSNAPNGTTGGAGGAGTVGIITGLTYGGGGGGSASTTGGTGGAGGGGNGGNNANGSVGVANTGGGGGGGTAGGSGIAIVQYAYATTAGAVTLSGTVDLQSASTLDAYGSGGLLSVDGLISTSAGAGGLTIASSNAAGGVVRLGSDNTYAGTTTVNSGATLLINGNQSGAIGAVSVAAAATLGGIGTVGGATALAGTSIHAPGSAASTVGKQTFSSSVTYNSGSIFEWNLASTPLETGRGTSYDAVNAASLGATSGAIFRVVLNGTQDFTDTFWDTSRTWSDIFKTGDAGSNLSIASIFTGTTQYYNVTSGNLGAPTGQGSFSFSGSSLTWTPIPEPTSALAGLLLTAGLLRRRRSFKAEP